MKKQLITSLLIVAVLTTSFAFANMPLTEHFTNLSKQIINQSDRPSDKLEELKKIFVSCAEKHKDKAIQSVCQIWLKESYPKIKEATSQQVYIELGSGDVEVKKVGKKRLYKWDNDDDKQGILYQVDIPKYHFSYQFILWEGDEEEKKLLSWNWTASWNLVIPNIWKDSWYASFFTLYAIPKQEAELSLNDIGEQYHKVYKKVFWIKNSKETYSNLFKYQKLNDFIFANEFLSFLNTDYTALNYESWNFGKHDGFDWKYTDFYGIVREKKINFFCENKQKAGIENLIQCPETLRLFWLQLPTNSNFRVFINKKYPNNIWVWGEKETKFAPWTIKL